MSGAIRKNRKFLDNADGKEPETYKPAGGKLISHGNSFHLSLLMYIFLKALKMEEDFSLGAEVGEAGKFDDIVYRYRKDVGSKRYNRLLQLKYSLHPENFNITLSGMLTTRSYFSLITYFKSFLEIKDNFSNEDEEIRDLIIYTNAALNLNETLNVCMGKNEQVTFIMKDTFKEMSDDEGVEVMDELLQSNLYCFRKDTEERGKWVKYLMERSERKNSELENDVNQFLDKLSFAIQQPETERLEEMVSEMLNEYVGNNSEEAFSQFYMYISKWLADKNGIYINRKDCLELIEELNGKHGRFNFGVGPPVLNFTGREKELKDLKKAFEDGKQRVVLCGMGGVGKTQLARMFAKRHTESFSCVLWLKSESYEDLENSFQNLAFGRLGIKAKRDDGKEKDIASILNEVKEVLQNRKCFFIFDNIQYMVEESTGRSMLDVFLSNLPDNYKLLMTSRRRDWENFFSYPLESFFDYDAALLIKESLKDHVKCDAEQVKDLAEVMQNLPLAIEQAIAYIKKKSKDAKQHNGTFGIDSYLTKFQANSKRFLKYNLQKYNDDDYLKTCMTTLNVSMEAIRKENNGKLCEDLFHRISYFYPDGIPKSDIVQCFTIDHIRQEDNGKLCEEIFHRISYLSPDGISVLDIVKCYSDKPEDDITASLQQLHDYSMVKFFNDECSVHRLVQNVTRVKLQERGKERAILDSLLRVCDKLDVRNVVSIWKHCEKHTHLIKKHSNMPTDVISNYINKGRFADGYVYGKRLVQVMESNLDPMDQSMNEVNFALARVTHYHGLYEESEKVLKQVYEWCCTNLGEEDRFTLRVRKQMARVLFDLGKYEECQDISKEVSEMCENILGRDDRDSIIARVNYSKCLRESGKLVKSYNMTKEACDTYERVLGTQDSDFIYARHELAKVLMKLERYEESLDILRNLWKWERNNRSEEHPNTLTIRHDVGAAQYMLRNYAESLEIFECVYECRRRTLGEEHPGTLNTRHVMGLVQFNLCNYAESIELLNSVYECRRRTLGEEHPKTLNTLHDMGLVQFNLCNYAESIELLNSVYECRRRTLGEEHPKTLNTLHDMGLVQFILCNYAESLDIFENVYECRRRTLGEEHPDTVKSRECIQKPNSIFNRCVIF